MDIREARDLITEAARYGIPCKYNRGDGFEYTLQFSDNIIYADRRKARKFIDAIVEKHGLIPGVKKYSLSFGWDII